MSPIPRLLGMVHLLPLPGSPGYKGSVDHVVETAVSDASALADAGFPALIVENYGDAPFFHGRVPAETVASMSVAARAVADETDLPLGVNVLRNDALSALAVAAAVGAVMIRVNVLSGMMYTDQGPIVGEAADVLRLRRILCPQVEIWADVMVKHAVAPPGVEPARLAVDTVERGGADAIIVSGPGTGDEPDIGLLELIADAVTKETRVVVGSGADVENLSRLLAFADTVVVGSAIKVDGDASNRVDPLRAQRFVEIATDHGLV